MLKRFMLLILVSSCAMDVGREPTEVERAVMVDTFEEWGSRPWLSVPDLCWKALDNVTIGDYTPKCAQCKVAYYDSPWGGTPIIRAPGGGAAGEVSKPILVHETIHLLQDCNSMDIDHADPDLWTQAPGSVLYETINKDE